MLRLGLSVARVTRSAMSQPVSTPATSAVRRLGRYTLRFRIAQGGMASVYLARLSSVTSSGEFARWVAVKTIHAHIASHPRFVTMFLDEARLAAQLDHPNLCSVFDFGEDEGTYYLAMEYLHGETLGVLARHVWSCGLPMPFELSARIVADAARGLHAAHELKLKDGAPAGVVHRDVSPENLFVTYSGATKVVDFGVARSNQQDDQTKTGELKGKLAYMAPEQIREQGLDRRVDLWALGVVLWEVTVGKRLFRREGDADTLFAVLRDEIVPPSRLRPGYPAALEAIVMKALSRTPGERFATALEMARALDAFITSTGLPAGTSEVADFLQTFFADQKAYRDALLTRASDAPDGPVEELVEAWQSARPPSTQGGPPPPAPPPSSMVEEALVMDAGNTVIPLTRHSLRVKAVSPDDAEAFLLKAPSQRPKGALSRSDSRSLSLSASGALRQRALRPRWWRRGWVHAVAALCLAVAGLVLAWQWSQRPSRAAVAGSESR